MKKRELSAREYHWETCHVRHQIQPHRLDFANYPLAFKPCDSLGKIPLDTGFLQQGGSFPEPEAPGPGQGGLDFGILSQLLFLAYGVSSFRETSGFPLLLRTVPSAGGLYPCHLYLAMDQVPGLETGVYYFDPVHFCLVPLAGNAGHPQADTEERHKKRSGTEAPRVYFMVTASFYNSAWKYRQRAFRYMLLDAGHLVENLGLVLDLYGVSHSVLYDFPDHSLSDLLGLDPDQEVPLACVSAGWDIPVPDLCPAGCGIPEKSKALVSYEILSQIHEAGTLIPVDRPLPRSEITPQKRIQSREIPGKRGQKGFGPGFVEAVLSRRSRRNFVVHPMALAQWTGLFTRIFSNLFENSGTLEGQGREPKPRDPAARAQNFLTLGIICQNLEGLADGFHVFSRDFSRLDLMKRGSLAPDLARVCLDQQWIGHANMNFLFMANLNALETGFGPRGYRYLMFNAGRIAQRIYLAAQDQGLGCCGIGALYDGEAKALLDLNEESALVYGVAAGCIKKMHG